MDAVNRITGNINSNTANTISAATNNLGINIASAAGAAMQVHTQSIGAAIKVHTDLVGTAMHTHTVSIEARLDKQDKQLDELTHIVKSVIPLLESPGKTSYSLNSNSSITSDGSTLVGSIGSQSRSPSPPNDEIEELKKANAELKQELAENRKEVAGLKNTLTGIKASQLTEEKLAHMLGKFLNPNNLG